MKRREFLQLLGVTATVPLMGTDVVARAIKPVIPIEPVLPVTPVTPIKPIAVSNNQIVFEGIGTYDMDCVIEVSQERAVAEYQCLANFETVKIPTRTTTDVGFRLRTSMKEVKKFHAYFNEFKPVSSITINMENSLITMGESYLSDIAVISDAEGVLLQINVSTDATNITYKG